MPKKYVKRFSSPILHKRTISATTCKIKFNQFMRFLYDFCDKVIVRYHRLFNTQKVQFEIEVIY